MLRIKEAIIVEGIYDKMKLEKLVDTVVVVTNGFSIFKNKEIVTLIKQLAEKDGVIVLTDSDRAGFTIRNYIKSFIPPHRIKHAYIPEIKGKERRKTHPGKEGILGVEGLSDEAVVKAIRMAGYSPNDGPAENNLPKVTKMDLYRDGLYGRPSSSINRSKMLKELDLPSKIETNAMLQILNHMLTYDEYKEICKKVSQ